MNKQTTAVEISDQRKGYISCSFMILAFVLPVLGFFLGWGKWDVETGATIGVTIFAVLMLLAVLVAFTIKHISWLFTFLPTLSGLLYSIAPDFIPGPFEDVMVLGVGLFFTATLIAKKVAPPYLLVAMVGTGIYAWFGQELVPGLADELILFLILLASGFAIYQYYTSQRPSAD